jgi:hypothetical protein
MFGGASLPELIVKALIGNGGAGVLALLDGAAPRSDQGDLGTPADNIYAAPVIVADVQARYGNQQLMVVSSYLGGVVRARALAKASTTPRLPSSTALTEPFRGGARHLSQSAGLGRWTSPGSGGQS